MKRHYLLLWAVATAVMHSSLAQQTTIPKNIAPIAYPNNTWSLDFRVGATQFYGDLRQYNFYPTPANSDKSVSERGTWSAGVSLNKQLSHVFGVGFNFDKGTLKGTKYRLYRSYFDCDFYQYSLTGNINLNPLLFGSKAFPRWRTELWGGIGMMGFNSRAYEIGTGRLQRFTNFNKTPEFIGKSLYEESGIKQGNNTHEIVFPVGMRVAYELNDRFDLGLEVSLTNTTTEKIDATIGNDFSTLYTGGGNIWGLQAGPSATDKWGNLALTLTWKLGKNRAWAGRARSRRYPLDPNRGAYHLRWTDPDLIQPPVNNPPKSVEKMYSQAEVDSIAKAASPEAMDPRLSMDSDGDGVSDFFDKEPNTPAGSIVSGGGVAIDFDKYLAEINPQSPCSQLFATVLFETDRTVIKRDYFETLARIVDIMTKTRCRIQLSGHADRRSSDRYNMQLSERRVQAIKKFLIGLGIPGAKERILTDSFGSFKPVADNTTTEGRMKNRRVEIKFIP